MARARRPECRTTRPALGSSSATGAPSAAWAARIAIRRFPAPWGPRDRGEEEAITAAMRSSQGRGQDSPAAG